MLWKIYTHVMAFVIGLLVLALLSDSPHDYKQGQIDALTGKVQYELVVHPDSTRSWEKIK